jgi:hypothetical protein
MGDAGANGAQGPQGPAGTSPWGLDGGNNTFYTTGQVLVGTSTPNASNTMSVVGGTTNGIGASNATAASVAVLGASTGSGSSAGVQGSSTSATGFGVNGVNSNSTGQSIGSRGETLSNTNGARGVFGVNTSTTNPGAANSFLSGVYGQSISNLGANAINVGAQGVGNQRGVEGDAATTTGIGVIGFGGTALGGAGVQGQVAGDSAIALFGANTSAAAGFGRGVQGQSSMTDGTGVQGICNGTGTQGPWGVSGSTTGAGGTTIGTAAIGVRGSAGSASAGTNFRVGVYGEVITAATNAYAGYFSGKVNVVGALNVTGALSKGSGTFKIDHPLDPANKFLYHSFVESPDMMNVYNGVVVAGKNGTAVVELPSYFETLNKDFRYQLTCIGGFAPVYVASEVQGNRFVIAGANPGMKVSWQVTGVRQDPYANQNRVIPEVDKSPEERGLYLYPEAYGLPRERAIGGDGYSPKTEGLQKLQPVERVAAPTRGY